MVREDYNGCVQMIYFRSEKDRKSWCKAAKNVGESVSQYILEMATLGQDKRMKPNDDPQDVAKLREEIAKLQSRNKDLEAIRENSEAELLKLRHKAFLQPQSEGYRRYSRSLVDLLQSGGTWSGRDILKAMHVQPTDSEAVEIVLNQLRGLETYGLVEESVHGWRWMNRG